MTEAELQKAIIDAAILYGWRVHHDRPARTAKGWRTAVEGHAGFPDLVLARKGRVLFIECKSASGELTAEQRSWAFDLPRGAFVVRPSQLDWILEMLR